MPVYFTILFQNKQLQFLKFQKNTLYKKTKYDIMFSVAGLVAQLGERSVRIREVEGSNPFESTTQKA